MSYLFLRIDGTLDKDRILFSKSKELTFPMGINGYLFAKYFPELLIKLIKNLTPTNEYFQVFFSGSKEFEMEVSRNELSDLDRIRREVGDREWNVERDL